MRLPFSLAVLGSDPGVEASVTSHNSKQGSQELMLVQNLCQLIEKRPQSVRVSFLRDRPAQFTHADNESGIHVSPEWRVI